MLKTNGTKIDHCKAPYIMNELYTQTSKDLGKLKARVKSIQNISTDSSMELHLFTPFLNIAIMFLP